MTGKQLKNSILQWAIQGKLVPQDPNDEPASVLLERIREEKARLVKEKKIKKPKNESIIYGGDDNSHYEKFADGTVRCIDDEIPFEIPDSWMWCNVRDICSMQAGKNISSEKIFSEQSASYPFRCIGGNGLRGFVATYNTEGSHAIVGRQGALCGCLNIECGRFYATEHAVVVDNYGEINYKFMYWFLMAMNLNQYATATAQPGLSVAKILDVKFPLPPIAEQYRIVERLESILPHIERYSKVQHNLDTLNKEIKTLLQKSILQEAIQGRLVSQNPKDEPASVLLERIRLKKALLIKEKKIKKDKAESLIFRGDDNCYYEQIG
ncbi:MAG: restriction endonuclease subunit S, partial [Bacteroidales bacterium]|nr:restriction endonuclease subunit S [Bacteroidales bacterium]